MLPEDMHGESMNNALAIKAMSRCSCFYCVRHFDASEITRWIHERRGADTAVCPLCDIDAVLAGERPISVLEMMRRFYFELPGPMPEKEAV